MKKLLFIFNPVAGKSRLRSYFPEILNCFAKEGWLTTVWPTQGREDAAQITRIIGEQYDRIICAGGDGTLSEVTAGLTELSAPPPLGYIPAGSTNDFSRSLKLPRDVLAAAKLAATGTVRPCDLGRFNGKPFVYIAAFGAFADVSYATPQEVKKALGHLAYVLEGVKSLPTLRNIPLSISHDGGTLSGEFLFGMVGNTTSVGGIFNLRAVHVTLDDGLFEAVLIRRPSNYQERQSILRFLMQPFSACEGAVCLLHTSRLEVTSQTPIRWSLDGEFGGSVTHAVIENQPKSLPIIRPNRAHGSS
ncbi:MAG: Transcription regulator [Oscillospiraceae bacterium]|nr:Transcription regulator [Oscillospiraceae bacterium]